MAQKWAPNDLQKFPFFTEAIPVFLYPLCRDLLPCNMWNEKLVYKKEIVHSHVFQRLSLRLLWYAYSWESLYRPLLVKNHLFFFFFFFRFGIFNISLSLLLCFSASLFFCFLLFCFSPLVCFYSSLLLCFSTFLLLCFFASLLLHCAASLLLRFSAFPSCSAFPAFSCFSAFPASLLTCFSASAFPSFLFIILQIILKKHHVNKP